MPNSELGPLFQPPAEPHALWLLIAVLSFVIIALALVALVRGRLPTGFDAATLMLVPVFTYVLGDLFLLEESKRVEFCGSCHETMSPVVDAMRHDDATLAAIHYRSGAVSYDKACYQCHSGYGIRGGAGAKLAGVRHMIRTATGNYSFPLEHHGRFDVNSCRNCHATAEPFRAVEVHRDPELQAQLLAGEISCAGLCHPEAHPMEALQGAAAR